MFSEQAETADISKARVEIKSIKFIGVGNLVGGATECIKTPAGFYASANSAAPKKCDAGYEPNFEQSGCEPCVDGYFNSISGKTCRKCPKYTRPNKDRTACDPYDSIVSHDGRKFNLYKTRPDQMCLEKDQQFNCNKNKTVIGPIDSNEGFVDAG